jgi:hypothetical protein
VITVDRCTIPFDFTIGSICVLGTLGLWIIAPIFLAVLFGGFGIIVKILKNILNGSFFEKDNYTAQIKPERNNTHVVKDCPNCKTKIRLPIGKVGTVKCPSCQKKIYTSTK